MGGCKMEEIEINLDEFNKTVNELNNIANKFNTTSTKIKNIGNSLEKNWDGKSGKAFIIRNQKTAKNINSISDDLKALAKTLTDIGNEYNQVDITLRSKIKIG